MSSSGDPDNYLTNKEETVGNDLDHKPKLAVPDSPLSHGDTVFCFPGSVLSPSDILATTEFGLVFSLSYKGLEVESRLDSDIESTILI